MKEKLFHLNEWLTQTHNCHKLNAKVGGGFFFLEAEDFKILKI